MQIINPHAGTADAAALSEAMGNDWANSRCVQIRSIGKATASDEMERYMNATTTSRRISLAIAGLGNCAGSLIEGLSFYRHPAEDGGLLCHPRRLLGARYRCGGRL